MRLLSAALALTALGCSSWFDGTRAGTYSGIYVTAFEASAFRPCGSSTNWWLTDASGSLYNQLPPVDPSSGARSAHLVVRGRRSSEGQYGHLGSYPRELVVTEVLDVSADTTGKCR